MTAIAGGVNFCLRCGGAMEVRERYGRERAVCPVCGYIHFLNPTPVAGCIVEHDGQIVLVRRGIEPGRGLWGIPAGFMEWGETAEEGAMRETAEETGLTVRIKRLLGVYSFVNPHGSGVIIFYVATAISGTLVAGDDAEKVVMFAPGAWPDAIAFPTHRQALADYRASISRA